MADRPPFQLTEKMLENPREFIERLMRLIEELYRTKRERPFFSINGGGMGI